MLSTRRGRNYFGFFSINTYDIYMHILQFFYDWGGEIITVIGIAVGIILGLVKLPEDEKVKNRIVKISIIAIIVLVFGVCLIKMRYTYVPDINLAEESLDNVYSQLTAAGLRYTAEETKFDEKAQKRKDEGKSLTDSHFKVVKCNPEPGEFVGRKKVVELCVSWIDKPIPDDGELIPDDGELIKKADTIIKKGNFDLNGGWRKVPKVKELTQETAEKILGTLKISYRISGEGYSDTVETGKVLSQEPEAGTDIEANTEVILVISKGSEPIQMPNVVGMSRKKAKNKLKKLGLKVIERENHSDTVPEGYVMYQSVNAGGDVMLGEEVEIEISKGPQEDKPKPTATPAPTETPVPPSPKPTATPAPTETPVPPSPPPTDTPVPTETPPPVPTEIIDDPDTSEIPGENVK